MMSQALENRLPPPNTTPEYTEWKPFPGEQRLGEREITSEGDESEFGHLDTLQEYKIVISTLGQPEYQLNEDDYQYWR